MELLHVLRENRQTIDLEALDRSYATLRSIVENHGYIYQGGIFKYVLNRPSLEVAFLGNRVTGYKIEVLSNLIKGLKSRGYEIVTTRIPIDDGLAIGSLVTKPYHSDNGGVVLEEPERKLFLVNRAGVIYTALRENYPARCIISIGDNEQTTSIGLYLDSDPTDTEIIEEFLTASSGTQLQLKSPTNQSDEAKQPTDKEVEILGNLLRGLDIDL